MKNLESHANVLHIQREQFKNETGITLIALIITIIVMLILVGVTINFTLNGGIITKSKTANSEYQKAADREELQLAIVASMDSQTGEVVRQNLVSSLSSDWKISNSAPYTCTSPKGNTFIVTADGKIVEGTSQGEEEEIDEFSSIKLYANKNCKSLLDDEVTISEGVDMSFGVLLTDTGNIYFCQVGDDEPTAVNFLLLWACSINQYHVVDSIEVEVNGNLVTYENAIISITSAGDGTNKIYGYVDKDNNTITLLNATRAGVENNDKDENGFVVKYSSITEDAVLSPERLVTAKDLNLTVYEQEPIENDGQSVKELVAINPSRSRFYNGVQYNEIAANSSGLAGLADFQIWHMILECSMINTFEATMSDESTKTFNNVIMTQRSRDFTIIKDKYEPIGYIDGDMFIPLDSNYSTDDSNYDANGYPKVYTSLEVSETEEPYYLEN